MATAHAQRDEVPAFRIVVIAASAGGIQALTDILSRFPGGLPVPIVVVQHVDPRHRSLLVEILSRRVKLPVEEAAEGSRLEPAKIYIAPPDSHLLVNQGGTLSLSKSELVHFVRPSADLLFESAAATYEEGTIAVVLTGAGEDGAMGVRAVKKVGGTVIAQDEATSEFFGMPGAAIATGDVDFVLPLDEIPEAVATLVADRYDA